MKTIVAKLLFVLLIASPLAANAQEIVVRGRVLDSRSKALPGVNVVEKGTANGTAVAADGTFSLKLKPGTSTIIFRFIGYKDLDQAIEVDGKANLYLAVMMIEDNIKNRRHQSRCDVQKHPL